MNHDFQERRVTYNVNTSGPNIEKAIHVFAVCRLCGMSEGYHDMMTARAQAPDCIPTSSVERKEGEQ